MFLKLYRTEIGPTAVTGKLYVDNVAFCDTLEPGIADANVALRYGAPGCIAPGFYPVRLTMSPRFGEVLPLIDRVIGRTGIRIHPGNTTKDTTGCILVGTLDLAQAEPAKEEFSASLRSAADAAKEPRLVSSKHAFMHLRARMQRAAKNKEEIWIEIVDATDLARNQDLYYDQATHTLYEGMPDSTLRVVIPQEVVELMRLQGNWDPIPTWEDRVSGK